MEGIIAGKGFVVNGQKDVFFGYQVGAGDMYGSPFAALNGEGTMFLTSLDYHGGSDFFETWYTSYGIMSRSFLADNGWVEKDTLFRLPLHHEGTVTLATLEDIPPPQDVAAAVATHNTDGEAHADIRKAAADAIALATNFTGRVLEVGGVSATGGTVSVDNGAPDKYTHYDAGDPTTFRLANEDGAQMTTFRMYKDSRGVFHPYDNLAGIEWTQVSPSEVTLSLQGSTAVMMRLVMASDPGNPDLFTMSWQSSAGWTLTDNGVGVVSGAARVTLTPAGIGVTASGKTSQLLFPSTPGTLATREWAGGEFATKGDLDGKLDKVTTVSNLSRVYAVSSVGVQSMIGYNHNPIADTLVLRSGTQINTDLLPVNPSHAASKKYVDDAVQSVALGAVKDVGGMADVDLEPGRAVYRFRTGSASVTVLVGVPLVQPPLFNGTAERTWEVRIDFTNKVSALSAVWDDRIKWVGHGTPEITVWGEYRFRMWSSDGVSIYATQVYPTVHDRKRLAWVSGGTVGVGSFTQWLNSTDIVNYGAWTTPQDYDRLIVAELAFTTAPNVSNGVRVGLCRQAPTTAALPQSFAYEFQHAFTLDATPSNYFPRDAKKVILNPITVPAANFTIDEVSMVLVEVSRSALTVSQPRLYHSSSFVRYANELEIKAALEDGHNVLWQ